MLCSADDDDEDSMYSGKFLNGNVVEDGFIMCKRRKGEKDEKYIINQSNSLTLIWLVFWMEFEGISEIMCRVKIETKQKKNENK